MLPAVTIVKLHEPLPFQVVRLLLYVIPCIVSATFLFREWAFVCYPFTIDIQNLSPPDQIGVEKCKQPFPILWDEQKKFFGIE